MLSSKSRFLGPLLTSRQGQHLTIYAINSDNVVQLKRDLREALDEAYSVLAPALNPETLVKFLAPLHNFIDDTKLLQSLKGNIGLFRNQSAFRIISIPVAVQPTCIVATSFHVKPLLRWMQGDREFLFLGMTNTSATLYHGSQSTFHLIDTIVFPNVIRRIKDQNSVSAVPGSVPSDLNLASSMLWVNQWLSRVTEQVKPPLYLAGESHLTRKFLEGPHYERTNRVPIWPSFSLDETSEICAELRRHLLKASIREVEHSLIEYYQAEAMNLASKNLFQIAKAALKGKVRKLIIADEVNIFGKVDRKSGGLSIHPAHLDHEDDDVLDDLAQEVLARGGEVVIASRDDIPKGRPILAILDRTEQVIRNGRSFGSLSRLDFERGAR